MSTDGFYKLRDGELFYAPESVSSLDYDLHRDLRLTYTYPIDGWRWFDTENEARAFYGLAQLESPEEQTGPNYRGFYDDLIAAPVYQTIRAKATLFQPLLAASTEFIAAFADAKAGRPNVDAIRMSVWNLFYWLQPAPADIAAIQQMLIANKLDQLYPLAIPQPVLDALEAQPNPFKFYESILASNFYQTKLVPIILSGTSSVPGDATTIIYSAIKDAQAGLIPLPAPGDPPNSFQTRLWLWVSAVGPILDADDFIEAQGLLEAANLADYYTLTPPTP
jgi:hypothetical protein